MEAELTQKTSFKPLTEKVLGLMSGTSLDGLDALGCHFDDQGGYSIDFVRTFSYDEDLRHALEAAPSLTALELIRLENRHTQWTADKVRGCISAESFQPDLIGAHGHTVFHQPDGGLTTQILNGAMLAALTSTPVVCDFRRADVALGGQGAPLVPIGDRLLFGEYDACLNLGGFANISYEGDTGREAFDICPANIVLNELAGKLGREFDEGGALARSGQRAESLLDRLSALAYYRKPLPKSLGREWVESYIFPLLFSRNTAVEDLLHTFVLHIAEQLATALKPIRADGRVLVTGGGAYNVFLMEQLGSRVKQEVVVPAPALVDGKEALVFAWLAKLRVENRINVLASVTGAPHDHCAGSLHLGRP